MTIYADLKGRVPFISQEFGKIRAMGVMATGACELFTLSLWVLLPAHRMAARCCSPNDVDAVFYVFVRVTGSAEACYKLRSQVLIL